MYEKKLKVEKIELVKKFIRTNNYHDHDNTLQMCIEAGINVNLPALIRFSDKLALLDSAERSRLNFDDSNLPFELKQDSSSPATEYQKTMTHDEVERREQEITFELGTLKIKEHELLTELSNLSSLLKDKH